jgi:HAMP domain-containing protein
MIEILSKLQPKMIPRSSTSGPHRPILRSSLGIWSFLWVVLWVSYGKAFLHAPLGPIAKASLTLSITSRPVLRPVGSLKRLAQQQQSQQPSQQQPQPQPQQQQQQPQVPETTVQRVSTQPTFEWLGQHGGKIRGRIQTTESGPRLFSNGGIPKGTKILEIPAELCIFPEMTRDDSDRPPGINILPSTKVSWSKSDRRLPVMVL